MRTLLTAAAAFVLVALMSGQITPSPHWQVVAADLHQAQPQARMKAQFHSLFQGRD